MASSLRERLDSRWGSLKSERSSWDPHWQELSNFILPRKGAFMVSDHNLGGKRNTNIIDNTGTLAARTLASGMMAGITSPARPWFRLATPDPDMMEFAPVKVWLSDVESTMRTIFNRSNIYNGLHSMYSEHGVFGTACLAILEDFEDVARAYPFTIGSYALGTSNRLVVDSVYRQFPLTVGQTVRWFGKENVSNTVIDLFNKGSYDQTLTVRHAIEPNDDRIHGLIDAKNKAYRSVYWEEGADKENFLRVSGFDSFPVMAPRWEVTGNDVYGRSAGMDALGDIKQLQTQQLRKGQAIEKMVNPPMTGPAALRNGTSNTMAGGITFVDAMQGQQGFQPAYQVQPRINELSQDINETQTRIQRAFYEDLFLMLSQTDRRQITAREIEERHEEKLLMLGPVLERLHDELLDPLIDRVFSLASNAGILPEPPEELAGLDLKVEYISVLAQAQKMVGISGIDRLAGFVGNMAQMNPDILDKFDFDQSVDEYGENLGVSPKIIRSDDQVQELRAQRAQQQQAQQQAAAMDQAANTAKTMSDTTTADKNALTDLIAGVTGG